MTESVKRAMALLDNIVTDGGRRSLTDIATDMDLSLATAHRLAQTLLEDGWLTRSRRGYYHAGPKLARVGRQADPIAVTLSMARPILARLAARFHCLAHLGVFEDSMVTYLLKEGSAQDALFTRPGTRLEAYCTGIGKVLLAALNDDDLDDYLDNGPFVRLTANTIVEPAALRMEIATVRHAGFAIDNHEVSNNLFCLAVPLADISGHKFAAVSLSFPGNPDPDRMAPLTALLKERDRIQQRMEPFWAGIES